MFDVYCPLLTSMKLLVIKCRYFCFVVSSESNFMTVTSSTTIPHFEAGQQIACEFPSSIIWMVKYWRQQSLQYSWSQLAPTISWNINANKCPIYTPSKMFPFVFINGLIREQFIYLIICRRWELFNMAHSYMYVRSDTMIQLFRKTHPLWKIWETNGACDFSSCWPLWFRFFFNVWILNVRFFKKLVRVFARDSIQ